MCQQSPLVARLSTTSQCCAGLAASKLCTPPLPTDSNYRFYRFVKAVLTLPESNSNGLFAVKIIAIYFASYSQFRCNYWTILLRLSAAVRFAAYRLLYGESLGPNSSYYQEFGRERSPTLHFHSYGHRSANCIQSTSPLSVLMGHQERTLDRRQV